jgi:hypothetical protein
MAQRRTTTTQATTIHKMHFRDHRIMVADHHQENRQRQIVLCNERCLPVMPKLDQGFTTKQRLRDFLLV